MENACLIANGFLPTRGSWTLDFVSVVMLAVIAALLFSIYQVRVCRNHKLHRTIQTVTAVALTVALVMFEIDMRFFTNWRDLAAASPYYGSGVVGWSLMIHLSFAIPTPVFWGIVIVTALRNFRHGFDQGDFNRWHRVAGRVAAGLMLATAITGWVFYYLAFVA